MVLDKKERRRKRKERSKRVEGRGEFLRVILSESNKYLRAQVIDDELGHTLCAVSTEKLAKGKEGESKNFKNKFWAVKLAESIAEKTKKNKLEKKMIFDRNSRMFHGKAKAFWENFKKITNIENGK